MKWRLIGLVVLAAWLSPGCNNDLDLVADWKEIPVVYGFLSVTDTAQYIRVQKAYLDNRTSALVIAGIPDSVYFQDIAVELEDISSGTRYPLVRVDAALEGYPRKEGLFANSPNYMYKIRTQDMNLAGDRNYRLIVSEASSGRMITQATTPVVGSYEMQFSAPANPIFFRYDNSIRFTWRSTERTAHFYDVRMLIHLTEAYAGDPAGPQPKVLEWQVEKGLLRGLSQGSVSTQVAGIEFFRFLAANLEARPDVIRNFKHIDIVVDAGARDFYDYLSVGQANSGITGAEFVASYSNINNGIGLLSSRSRLVAPQYLISPVTRDSLRNGIFTSALNFL